jgi:hypothetical protein
LGVKDFTVLLYAADSVPDSLFANRAPLYAAITDAEGNYDLPYLRPRRYYILGTDDANRDYRYGLPSEALALPLQLEVNLTGDSLYAVRPLRAFRPDATPPTLSGLRWLSDRLVAFEFTEPAISACVQWPANPTPDTLRLQAPDNPKRLLYYLPTAPPDSFRLALTHVQDTLGNALDTTLVVFRPTRTIRDTLLKFKPLELTNQPLSRSFLLNAPLAADSALLTELVRVEDTAGIPQPLRIRANGLTLTLEAAFSPDTSLAYTLVLDSALRAVNGARPDSTLRSPLYFRGLSNYAKVAGSLVAPPGAPPLIVYLVHTESKKRIRLETNPFSLPYTPPGTYRPLVVADLNADGAWTPGLASPLRQPEPVVLLPQEIKVRPGWEFEDVAIEVPAFWE